MSKAPNSPKPARKRYVRPEVSSSEAFERLALSCSGTNPGGTAKGGGRRPPPCTVQSS